MRVEADSRTPGCVVSRLAAPLAGCFYSVVSGWSRSVRRRAVPGFLPQETLSRAGCLLRAAPLDGVMPPAACYHVYHSLEGARLEAPSVFVTTRGRCFRDEAEFQPSLGRLRVFEMREIVALGSREGVEEFRQSMIDRVRDLVTELDLAGRIEIATDPFFLQGPGNESRGRRLMQQFCPQIRAAEPWRERSLVRGRVLQPSSRFFAGARDPTRFRATAHTDVSHSV